MENGNNISQLRQLLSGGKIFWTEHVVTRLHERGIKRADVIECIEKGEIIKQYPDDAPFPSYLISGICADGKPLHVVAGLNFETSCCIITAYLPHSDKWENNFKTRKAGK